MKAIDKFKEIAKSRGCQIQMCLVYEYVVGDSRFELVESEKPYVAELDKLDYLIETYTPFGALKEIKKREEAR